MHSLCHNLTRALFFSHNKKNSMKRDGANTSLWQMNMEDFQPANKLRDNKKVDVIIAGGGVTGVATALQLQKSGKQCVLLEAMTLCFGTTGGTTAHLNTFLDKSYDQIKSNFGEDAIHLVANATARSLDLYHSNIEEYSIDCGYEVKNAYLYSQNVQQTEELDKIYDASVLAGVDVAYTDRIPVDIGFEKAIVYRNNAQIHPAKYVLALAKAFESAGGMIIQKCRVENSVEADD